MSTSDTPTPRANALIMRSGFSGLTWKQQCSELFDFARQLERECASLAQERDAAMERANRAMDQLTEARKDSERLEWLTRYWDSQCTGRQPIADQGMYPNPTGSYRDAIDAAREGGR